MYPLGRWFGDLAVVGFFTAVAATAVASGASGWLRTAAVVPLVTVLPGYAFVALLYPRSGTTDSESFDQKNRGLSTSRSEKAGIDPIERIVLSVLLSVVIVPVVVLGSNFTPWGITLGPVFVGVVGCTALLLLGATVRRLSVPSEERFTPDYSILRSPLSSRDTGGFGSTNSGRDPFNVALVVAVVLLVASVGYAAANPPSEDGFTELYVQTGEVTGETESMYPSQFAAGESRPLPLVVANEERLETRYTLVVLEQRVDRTGTDERVTETVTVTRQQFSLEPGENRTESVTIAPTMSGSDLRITVLLYRGGVPDDPSMDSAHRVLRLPIDVESGDGA